MFPRGVFSGGVGFGLATTLVARPRRVEDSLGCFFLECVGPPDASSFPGRGRFGPFR